MTFITIYHTILVLIALYAITMAFIRFPNSFNIERRMNRESEQAKEEADNTKWKELHRIVRRK